MPSNPFKHTASTPRSTAATANRSAGSRCGDLANAEPFERLTVPEVHESDDEAAWKEWEQSQIELDSRMGPLSGLDSIKVKEASPSGMADLDPFAFVRTSRRR